MEKEQGKQSFRQRLMGFRPKNLKDYLLAEHLYEKYIKNQYLRIALSGCLLVVLTLLLGTLDFLGSGMGIIEHIFHHGETNWYTFPLKMLFTAITLGAGFKGGEIVPSFTIGAALGCTAATVMGMPVELVAVRVRKKRGRPIKTVLNPLVVRIPTARRINY